LHGKKLAFAQKLAYSRWFVSPHFETLRVQLTNV
jgi:hypothetical protein